MAKSSNDAMIASKPKTQQETAGLRNPVSTQSRAYEVLLHARIYVLNSPWETEVALSAAETLGYWEYLLRSEEAESR